MRISQDTAMICLESLRGDILEDKIELFWQLSKAEYEAAILWAEYLIDNYEPEKTGRWEWNQYDYNPNLGNWHCSECRSVVIECVDKNEKGGIPLYKYCPQCGAKMEVEE